MGSVAKRGIPLVALCIVGSLGLTQLLQGKREIEDLQRNRRSLTTREFDLEEEYKKTLQKLDIDEFEVVRIKRPADETGS